MSHDWIWGPENNGHSNQGTSLGTNEDIQEHTMDPVAEENSEADNNLEMLCSTYVLFPSSMVYGKSYWAVTKSQKLKRTFSLCNFLFWDLFPIPLICVCVCSKPHCFDYCSFIK